MADEYQAYYLNPDQEIDSQFDLDKLREEAIAKIQKYSGKVWTDHNIHDAGIAILEQLCFAIADISYQFGQLADFSSLDQSVGTSPYFQQPTEKQNSKINIKDFRRDLLEHPSIYKVFFIPSISYPTVAGLFDVVVFTEPDSNESDIHYFLEMVRNNWRPISSAIKAFHFPPDRKVEIHLSVEIHPADNLHQIIELYHEEMKEFLRGKHQNENLTQHRIIGIDDFADKVSFEIQSADLVARLNAVTNTKHIQKLSIKDSEFSFVWTLKYPKPYRLSLHPNSSITLHSNGVELTQWRVEHDLNGNWAPLSRSEKLSTYQNYSSNQVVYSSLQVGFPESFGLENEFNEPLKEEDSSALQIKGILSTFDLIISRFIAQLEKSYALLNNQNANLTNIAQNILIAIPGVEYIWMDFNQKYLQLHQEQRNSTKRFQDWKEYLSDVKNNLHELVSNTHRVEAEYLENQIQTYRFLLGLFGAELNAFDTLNPKITYENEAIRLKHFLDFWVNNRSIRIHAKQHNPQCLNRNSSHGFAGLISQYLGLDFETDSMVQGIEKISKLLTDNSKRKFSLESTFESLIRWGRNNQAYIQNDIHSITEIRNHQFELIGYFDEILDLNEIQESIDKLNQINDLAEGFLVIEHFEFAPEIDEATFGAHVLQKDRYLFEIEPKNKLKTLYDILRSFEGAVGSNNYQLEVKKIGHHQYVNYFKAPGIYQKLNGFFESEFSALKAQKELSESLLLQDIHYRFIDQQFYQEYNRIDPYSHQITLCFPNWNKPYWGNARKQKIAGFVDQITPPHLVCNIKWMDPFQLNELIQTIKRYHESKSKLNLHKIRQRIFQLLA